MEWRISTIPQVGVLAQGPGRLFSRADAGMGGGMKGVPKRQLD
jgi:hypothetical protein